MSNVFPPPPRSFTLSSGDVVAIGPRRYEVDARPASIELHPLPRGTGPVVRVGKSKLAHLVGEGVVKVVARNPVGMPNDGPARPRTRAAVGAEPGIEARVARAPVASRAPVAETWLPSCGPILKPHVELALARIRAAGDAAASKGRGRPASSVRQARPGAAATGPEGPTTAPKA